MVLNSTGVGRGLSAIVLRAVSVGKESRGGVADGVSWKVEKWRQHESTAFGQRFAQKGAGREPWLIAGEIMMCRGISAGLRGMKTGGSQWKVGASETTASTGLKNVCSDGARGSEPEG